MTPFALNLVLALAWALVNGRFGLADLGVGFLGGFGCLWVVRDLFPDTRYFRKAIDTVRLAVSFLVDLVVSSVRVLHDVFTLTHHARPAILAVPLDARTDLEILMVANLVTLTPGTLSMDVTSDRRTLYVHVMFLDDAEALRASLKRGIERQVLEVLG